MNRENVSNCSSQSPTSLFAVPPPQIAGMKNLYLLVGKLSNLFDRLLLRCRTRLRVRDSALQQRGGQTRGARLRSLCSRNHHLIICRRTLPPDSPDSPAAGGGLRSFACPPSSSSSSVTSGMSAGGGPAAEWRRSARPRTRCGSARGGGRGSARDRVTSCARAGL